MNSLRNIRQNSSVALIIAGLLIGCDRGGTGSTPTPSTRWDSTIAVPAMASGPATPPALGKPAPPSSTSSDAAVPEVTLDSRTGTAPTHGTRFVKSSHDSIARAMPPSAWRDLYGAELIQVVDETTDSLKLNDADRDFLKDAAAAGLYALEAAKVGSQRARDPAIKAFAEMLVSQQNSANTELKQFAGTWHVEIPDQPPTIKRRSIDHLRAVGDANFDRDFIRTVGIGEHEAAIKRFEKATHQVKDVAINAWAEKALPTLREHLAEALTLAAVSGIDVKGTVRNDLY